MPELSQEETNEYEALLKKNLIEVLYNQEDAIEYINALKRLVGTLYDHNVELSRGVKHFAARAEELEELLTMCLEYFEDREFSPVQPYELERKIREMLNE